MEKAEQVKYNAVYSKTKEMVYISHLDLMTLLRRALRRSGLSFVMSRGFTPRVKISTKRALKLGVESENEDMSFSLYEDTSAERIKKLLNLQLPDGVKIYDVVKA